MRVSPEFVVASNSAKGRQSGRQLWRNRTEQSRFGLARDYGTASTYQAAGELACRPGSVHPLARADGHPSRAAVAGSLMRSTREHRAGRPQSLAQERAAAGAAPS